MRRAAHHIRNRRITPAWHSWEDLTNKGLLAQAKKQATMTRALGHMLHRGLSKGWLAWRDVIETRILARRLLLRVRMRMNTKWKSWGQKQKAARVWLDRSRREAIVLWLESNAAQQRALADAFAAASMLIPVQQVGEAFAEAGRSSSPKPAAS